jgi:hypothetical protein
MTGQMLAGNFANAARFRQWAGMLNLQFDDITA